MIAALDTPGGRTPALLAVTGASISPPLFESMELLGRDRSLQRLRQARDGVERNLW